jgi:hypothetical protein
LVCDLRSRGFDFLQPEIVPLVFGVPVDKKDIAWKILNGQADPLFKLVGPERKSIWIRPFSLDSALVNVLAQQPSQQRKQRPV